MGDCEWGLKRVGGWGGGLGILPAGRAAGNWRGQRLWRETG